MDGIITDDSAPAVRLRHELANRGPIEPAPLRFRKRLLDEEAVPPQ